MKLMQLPRCLIGHHLRDPKRVHTTDTVYHGYCLGCGRAMVKDVHGWHLVGA